MNYLRVASDKLNTFKNGWEITQYIYFFFNSVPSGLLTDILKIHGKHCVIGHAKY